MGGSAFTIRLRKRKSVANVGVLQDALPGPGNVAFKFGIADGNFKG